MWLRDIFHSIIDVLYDEDENAEIAAAVAPMKSRSEKIGWKKLFFWKNLEQHSLTILKTLVGLFSTQLGMKCACHSISAQIIAEILVTHYSHYSLRIPAVMRGVMPHSTQKPLAASSQTI